MNYSKWNRKLNIFRAVIKTKIFRWAFFLFVLFVASTYSFGVNPTCIKAKLIVKTNPVIVKQYGEINGVYDFFSSWVSFETNPGDGVFCFVFRGERGWGMAKLDLHGSNDTYWLVENFEIVHLGKNEPIVGFFDEPLTFK